MMNGNDPERREHHSEPIIDVSIIDKLVDQLSAQLVHNLVEDCFAEFDLQVEQFKQAGARGDWAGCLTTLHGMRGIAVDYGATGLSNEITMTKQVLLDRRYDVLASQVRNLTAARRDARKALIMRLAKRAATEFSNNEAG